MQSLANMTQEQKDQLLQNFLAKEYAKQKREEYAKMGLSWSSNGFITLKQGKQGDKNLPALYIHPSFIGRLAAAMANIEAFANDSAAKEIVN